MKFRPIFIGCLFAMQSGKYSIEFCWVLSECFNWRHRFLKMEINDWPNPLDVIVEADDADRTQTVERRKPIKPKPILEYPKKASKT